jgi:hypothetical protein
MNTSNRESSTCELRRVKLPTYQRWLHELKIYSKKFQKYGSFLQSQENLLRQIHEAISSCASRVSTFTAPPSSGKTHVIALCASYFHDNHVPTCIVTPNNELKLEFRNELAEIDSKSSIPLPVITVGAFISKRQDYELAFIDEAHNLRSAMELDKDFVKSVHLEKGEPLYHAVIHSLDRNHATYVAKELNPESAHDILSKMVGSRYEGDARQIMKTLSQWRGFLILCGDTCDLKFMAADPDRRNLVPRGRLFLFSATLLDSSELQFYCSIPKEMVRTTSGSGDEFVPKKSVAYHYVLCESDYEKKNLAVTLLKGTKLRTLILLNSNSVCLNWKETLARWFGKRVITIESGLHYTERLRIYREFVSHPSPILLTSSSVFWEGLTIRDLKLLIIPNPPFPQPSLLEIAEGRHPQYQRIAKRRLIQGMGRVGRSAQQSGACLLFFRPSGLARDVKPCTKTEAKSLIKELTSLAS